MKYVTFVVPSYNSEKFLNKCIDSLLIGGDDVEIIIVNDGSKDNTSKIAHEYEKKYPSTIKVIDKENGGHGSGINKGIEYGTGLYLKVVDSDDWINPDGFKKYITTIKKNAELNLFPDIYYSKFYFDHFDENYKYAFDLSKRFPINVMFEWNKDKTKTKDILMIHSVTVKLSLLKDNKISVPEKCFYEDNYYIYQIMFNSQTMFYTDECLYHYYIGRSGQSVSVEGIKKHYQDYLTVLKAIFNSHSYSEIENLGKYHKRRILSELADIFLLTYYMTYQFHIPEHFKMFRNTIKELKQKDNKLYKRIKYGTLYFFAVCLFPPFRKPIIKIADKITNRNMHWG